MPYMQVEEEGGVAVYKQGPDGKPMGKRLGMHKAASMDEAHQKAKKQMAAIYANEKALGEKALDLSAKDMGMMPMMKMEPGDPRVMYGPMQGTDSQACANCQFFCAHEASCALIWDDVVATGKCNLWLGKPDKTDMQMANPLPVVIVEPPATGSAEAPDTARKETGIIAWLKQTFGKKQDEPLAKAGFKALPGNKWVSYYTNSFEDKTGEIFTEAAHDQYIDWLDKGQIPYPDLWYWHIPGTKHGQAEWIGRVDHVVVAAGSFDDSLMAALFRKEYEREAQKTSHTYGYPKQARDADGTYHAYFDIELSPLPANREANFWTPFMEVKDMPVTEEKKAKLEAILGKELASQVLGDGAKMSAELEALGIKFKEAEGLPAVDADARDALKELATANKASQDATLKQLSEFITANKATQETAAKQITDLLTALKTQGEAITKLETFVKEQFADAPRATTSAATVVPKDNGMAAFLATKQADPNAAPAGSVGEQIAAMVFKAATPAAS